MKKQKFIGSLFLAAFFQKFDSVIPIPLHRKKLKIRGFNQSDLIAEGIHNIHKIPIEPERPMRIKNTSSQTNKNRLERWDNVKSAFKTNNADKIAMSRMAIMC